MQTSVCKTTVTKVLRKVVLCHDCHLTRQAVGHLALYLAEVKGVIAPEESGTNGFGYDPIFMPAEAEGRTTADMPIRFKETYSHRARAVAGLMEWLRSRKEGWL